MKNYKLKYSVSDGLRCLFNLLLSISMLLANGPVKALMLSKENTFTGPFVLQDKKPHFAQTVFAEPMESPGAETPEDSESEDDQQLEPCTPQFLKFNEVRQSVNHVDSASLGIRIFKVPLYILFCSLKTFLAEQH